MSKKAVLLFACAGWLLFVRQPSLLAEDSATSTTSSNSEDSTDHSSESEDTSWDWWDWSFLGGGYGPGDQAATGSWAEGLWNLGW